MFSKVGDSGLPVVERGRDVSEQVLKYGNQVGGFRDVEIKCLTSVLIQDGALWGLEEYVVEWVASLAFFLHRYGEVVVYILRFPIGERESVFVDDCAVDNDAVSIWGAHRVLRNERGVHLLCAGVQERIKG